MNFVLLQNCVLLALTRLLLQCEGCSDGWFGRNCTFQCHCMKSPKCKSDGSCPVNDTCAIGYFGLGCQFADLAAVYSLPSVPPFLRDSDDTTCNPKKGATSVTLSLTRYILLSWFRIILNNNKNLLNFNTSLDKGKWCPSEKKFMHSSNGVDVMCSGNTNTSVLKIEGLIAEDICTVYISGGRNVALKQHVWQSSTLINDTDTYGSGNAVDGSSDRNYSHKHCSHTAKQVDRPEYNIIFDKYYYIHSILLLTNKTHSVTLNGSLIEGFDKYDRRTFVHQETLIELPTTYLVQLTSPALVRKISIKQHIDMPDYYRCMAICEVLVFGECEPKSYGIYCEMTCPEGCAESCHPETGNCACKHGYTGERCTKCEPKSYGIYCEMTCSEGCAESCHPGTGNCACKHGYTGERCTRCVDGFHGNLCIIKCPKLCKAGICDKGTGLCKACEQNHIGPRCEECSPGFYGESCNLQCSSGCLENKCNATNGVCACKHGFRGERCAECSPGFNGESCNLQCSSGCLQNKCEAKNGQCACKPEFRGERCTACIRGFHGDHCNLTCPALCADGLCNRNTGFCVKCAQQNHVGPRCEDCPATLFGPQCTTPCSSHCKENKCYPATGYCLACQDVYMGLECDMDNLYLTQSSPTVLCEKTTVTMLILLLAFSILFD